MGLQVKDVKTNRVINVPLDDTWIVRLSDGVKVRLHPNFISLTVKKGERFDGHTLLGPRRLVRVK